MAREKRAPNGTKMAPSKETKRSRTEAAEDSCRCKEVAKKTPKELLKVAIDDLSFWKRTKKG
jgi:hypothetical protein